jgi:predicted Zn-dependent protease
MDVEKEMRLGLDSARLMAAELGGAADPRDDPRARIVAQVGRRIVLESDARHSPYVGNYHFFLLNDPDAIDAFALPGGQVFLTRGLFDRLEDEAELAGVLGHELGHVVGRHAAEHMTTGRLGQPLSLILGDGGGSERGRRSQEIAALVQQWTQLRFTPEEEAEADRFGLRYLVQSGYDPSAMLDVMQILKKAGRGSESPGFLARHPLAGTRLEAMRQALARDYPRGIPRHLVRGHSLRAADLPR